MQSVKQFMRGILPKVWGEGRRHPRSSLLVSLASVLAGVIAFVSVASYFSIEYFISRQFDALHSERVARFAGQARAALREEQRYLDSLATLLASDSELNNSTYYHLYLEGERALPQAAVERLARAFQLASVSLATPQGRLVARQGEALPHQLGPGGRIVWHQGTAWLLASATIQRGGIQLARLEIAQPLLSRLNARLAGDIENLSIRPQPASDGSIPLQQDVFLSALIANPAQVALAEVQRLLLIILVLAGLALMLLTGWVLQRQLRPLQALARATERVGRGEFALRLRAEGSNEVTRLLQAFNAMTRQLGALRQLEARMEHEARLSAIGRVAARVAHDINNPLTVIGNVAQLLAREHATDTSLGKDLQLILHHNTRAAATVQQLLEFGRPLRPRLNEVDLGDLLVNWAERWNRRNKNPEPLMFDAVPASLRVNVDPLLIEQMLDNLVNNAFEAGAPVSLSLEIAGDDALIRVEDCGPGFPNAARQHLFEPFYTTKTHGSGLGLASALMIARAHGGDIVVAAGAPGRVTVRLPAVQARDGAP
jgi:signal transduction histidine kinase